MASTGRPRLPVGRPRHIPDRRRPRPRCRSVPGGAGRRLRRASAMANRLCTAGALVKVMASSCPEQAALTSRRAGSGSAGSRHRYTGTVTTVAPARVQHFDQLWTLHPVLLHRHPPALATARPAGCRSGLASARSGDRCQTSRPPICRAAAALGPRATIRARPERSRRVRSPTPQVVAVSSQARIPIPVVATR